MSVQVYFLAIKQVDPPQTVTRREEVKFDEIDFPVLFKVCFKPAFHGEKLNENGYRDIWRYFKGESMYNKSILGWAGHNKGGGVISSTQGITNDNFIIELVHFIIFRYPKEAVH